jgi:hypothetical protein
MLLSIPVLHSQSAGVITGTVADSSNKMPVAGVIVQLVSPQNRILAYTVTADNGVFSLRNNDSTGVLLFKSMGYRQYTVPVSKTVSPLNILLVAEPVQLRDVVIKAPDILLKGDTLVYNVDKYADAQDRTIADVLKKMPGIEVDDGGQIKYNGKPINKFYIEGSDFLEGRYGLATNNISHRDVQNVEVMENHQPVRALQGVEYSENAGINIRLKEDAKLRWVGVVNGGAGFSPFLYDASLFAMRITKKFQNMETARLNNTGWNPASQSLRYVYDDMFGYSNRQDLSPDYISVDNVSTPLADKRTRFNRSTFFNTTNSLRLNSEYEIKTNITYSGDKLNSAYNSGVEYFDSSISPLVETGDITSRKHDFSGQIILQTNKPALFLKNNFLFDAGLNTAASNITGSYIIGQKTETPVYRFSNDLQLAKRINNRILTVTSHNRFERKPHSLSVENGEKQYFQNATTTNFQSVTEASYGWIFGQWQIRSRVGVKYDFSGVESELNGINFDSYSLVNDSYLTVLNGYLRADAIYENKRLRINPYVVTNYYAYRFDDNRTEKSNHVFVSPSFFALYRFTARLELFANVKYALIAPTTNIFYRGLIMSNYRYLNAGYPSFDAGEKRSATVSLRYRNPVSSVFANVETGYGKDNAALVNNQIFDADQIITTYYPASNCSDNFHVNGSISKGIAYGKIRIGIDAGYFNVNTTTMRNSSIVAYELDMLSVEPKIKGTFAKWLTVNYAVSLNKNIMNIKDNSAASSYANLKQALNITFLPTKKLQINVGGEHYYSLFNDDTANNLILPDIGARWVISDKIDLNISATNLLNETNYRYSRYGTLNETIVLYRIRPRNIVVSLQMQF